MSSNARLFVVAGLLVALGLAVFVSPFASSEPDGLEKVATEQGFEGSADDHDLSSSPVADYRVDGVEDDRVATGLAGLVGVLVTFGLALGAFALLRVLRPSEDAGGEAAADVDAAAATDIQAGTDAGAEAEADTAPASSPSPRPGP